MHKGSCLCGSVTYEVRGELRPVIACHCTQCRKTTGHFMAATSTTRDDLIVTKSDGLAWYRSSDTARRAFCKTCGSTLFWEADGDATISIAAGTLDGPGLDRLREGGEHLDPERLRRAPDHRRRCRRDADLLGRLAQYAIVVFVVLIALAPMLVRRRRGAGREHQTNQSEAKKTQMP